MSLLRSLCLATLVSLVTACSSNEEVTPLASKDAIGKNNFTATQSEVLDYLNATRSKPCQCGTKTFPAAPPLTLNSKLNTTAEKHAVDMADHNYFSHTSLNGSQPWDRMKLEGYAYNTAGENIGAGYMSARVAVDRWIASPGHCANIMDPKFKELGVGYGYNNGSTYKHYWVTVFGAQQ